MTDVAELARKSSVSWIQVGPKTYPVWHEWVETDAGGAICIVGSHETGGVEQPLPPLADGDDAVVLLRSKTDRELAAAIPVLALVVEPGSEFWDPVTAALKAGRLNARDMPHEVERWSRECTVFRLVPQGPALPGGNLRGAHPRTAPRLS